MPNDIRVVEATKMASMSAYDWKNAWGDHDTDELSVHGAYQAISWVQRCVELRCNELTRIPVVYYRGKTGTTEASWEFAEDMGDILWMTEASLQIYGASYWLRLKNPYDFPKGFRWLKPSTIKPRYDSRRGLIGFKRTYTDGSGNYHEDTYKESELLYFWRPNLETEIGPGKGWVSTILTQAGVAQFMNKFASEFFERGAMPGTLLSVEGNPSKEELDRLESWWKRFVGGIKRAWETVAIRASVKPVVIGYPTDQLAMPELLESVRHQIAVAAGVPQTMIEDAANYATAKEHKQSFLSGTVVPEGVFIEKALNRQIFYPQNLHVDLDWHSMDEFQEDEAERSQALGHMTQAGIPLDLAMQMLGMELPGEMTYDDFKIRLEEDKQKGQERALQIASQRPRVLLNEQQREEMQKWQRKALRSLEEGKPAQVHFHTDIIDSEAQNQIHERLSQAETEEEVKAAFMPPFKQVERVSVRGSPPEPWGDRNVSITEDDIDAAFARWDQLMPEKYKGMLDAKVEE